jgi:hypothetical protein
MGGGKKMEEGSAGGMEGNGGLVRWARRPFAQFHDVQQKRDDVEETDEKRKRTASLAASSWARRAISSNEKPHIVYYFYGWMDNDVSAPRGGVSG